MAFADKPNLSVKTFVTNIIFNRFSQGAVTNQHKRRIVSPFGNFGKDIHQAKMILRGGNTSNVTNNKIMVKPKFITKFSSGELVKSEHIQFNRILHQLDRAALPFPISKLKASCLF